jgi:tripartite-type tricarboxylate transporter receptor subunit TctC
VELALLTPVAALVHLKAGKLIALGVTTADRLPLLSAVPTLAEAGLDGYAFEFWNALFAPAATPKSIINMLYSEVAAAARDAAIKDRYVALGFLTITSTPDELASVVGRELERFRRLAVDAGIGGRE